MKIEVEQLAHSFELISQGFVLRYKTGMFNHITRTDHVKEINLRENNGIAPKFTIIGEKISEGKRYLIIEKQ